MPEEKKATLIPPGVFEAWADATWATDPEAETTNQMLRAPNGVIQDMKDYWAAGKPYYDPAAITVPTLLIHAEWDADLPSYQAQAYFKKLVNVPYKRLIELGEGTHTVMLERTVCSSSAQFAASWTRRRRKRFAELLQAAFPPLAAGSGHASAFQLGARAHRYAGFTRP